MLASYSGRWLLAMLSAGVPIELLAVPASAQTESVLYSFLGGSDGVSPVATLVNVGGTLVGTTYQGGSGCTLSPGCGTVFTITPSGTKTILYNFQGGSDGTWPLSPLVSVGNTLYGTTDGGIYSGGTIYSVTLGGTESVVYPMNGTTDGTEVNGPLLNVGGTLYGLAEFGGHVNRHGEGGYGTVFSVTPAGVFNVLYTFKSAGHGWFPQGGLVAIGDKLYGAVAGGGANNDGGIFEITTAGKEKVIYSFKGGSDGAGPNGTLLNVGGTLYGTTQQGGIGSTGSEWGTVFSVTPAGAESVIYAFNGSIDGGAPNGSLIEQSGTLYGTAAAAGDPVRRCGAVFAVTPGGAETTLHDFTGAAATYTDGALPHSGLVAVGSALFGVTPEGGVVTSGGGNGTVFTVTP
jgi:uncharacterized repeat protein (TIGR03803 family)